MAYYQKYKQSSLINSSIK